LAGVVEVVVGRLAPLPVWVLRRVRRLPGALRDRPPLVLRLVRLPVEVHLPDRLVPELF